MKQELTIQGHVELTRAEITQIIANHLSTIHNLIVKKVVYVTENKTISSAVLEVKQETKPETPIPVFNSIKEKEERKNKGGFKRNNVGIFSYLKEFISDEKKKKTDSIKFDELYASVKDLFPKMTKDRLALYLYDKRQLKGVKFDNKNKIVII